MLPRCQTSEATTSSLEMRETFLRLPALVYFVFLMETNATRTYRGSYAIQLSFFPETLRRIHDAELKTSADDRLTVAEYLQSIQKGVPIIDDGLIGGKRPLESGPARWHVGRQSGEAIAIRCEQGGSVFVPSRAGSKNAR